MVHSGMENHILCGARCVQQTQVSKLLFLVLAPF